MQTPKRRPGRPHREPDSGERVGLSLRVTPETKRSLDAAAAAAGRSLSQEAELRLEQSFSRQALLSGAMSLAYGRQATAIVLTLARELVHAGRIGSVISTGKFETMENWVSNPFAYKQAIEAAGAVLEAFRPPGQISPVGPGPGSDGALITLAAIKNPAWGDQFPDQHRNPEMERFAAEIRDLAGDELVSRIPTEGATK